jgi:hypothetical protein
MCEFREYPGPVADSGWSGESACLTQGILAWSAVWMRLILRRISSIEIETLPHPVSDILIARHQHDFGNTQSNPQPRLVSQLRIQC